MTGTTAHRAAWVHVHGQINEGMTIDHRPTCDRRCVNVTHLRELSNFNNARRIKGKDWPLGECINGHSDDELIRQWIPSKNRYRMVCAPCLKKYHRDDEQRKRERHAHTTDETSCP